MGDTLVPPCAHQLTNLPLQSHARPPGTVSPAARIWQVFRKPFEIAANKAIPTLRQDTAGSQNLFAYLVRTPAPRGGPSEIVSLGLRPSQRSRLARERGMGMARARVGAPCSRPSQPSDQRCAKDQPARLLPWDPPTVSTCGEHSPPHKGATFSGPSPVCATG